MISKGQVKKGELLGIEVASNKKISKGIRRYGLATSGNRTHDFDNFDLWPLIIDLNK
jgi:hypothetical protein